MFKKVLLLAVIAASVAAQDTKAPAPSPALSSVGPAPSMSDVVVVSTNGSADGEPVDWAADWADLKTTAFDSLKGEIKDPALKKELEDLELKIEEAIQSKSPSAEIEKLIGDFSTKFNRLVGRSSAAGSTAAGSAAAPATGANGSATPAPSKAAAQNVSNGTAPAPAATEKKNAAAATTVSLLAGVIVAVAAVMT